MLLSQLLAARTDGAPRGQTAAPTFSADPDILGLTADSRAVEPGWLFAALPGSKTDGRSFIAAAVAKGAVAVLAPTGTTLPPDMPADTPAVPLVEDADPRALFAHMAAAFYGRQPETVVAVTGTNGKTSTVTFARQIWAALGRKAASLGTLGLIGPGLDGYGAMTTPDPVSLHRDLAKVADTGIDHLAMEASSHGLDQRRLDGVALAAGGFTNLTRDHLDYHGDMAAYLAAKAGLFGRLLPPGAAAVINTDTAKYETLAAVAAERGLRVIGYGAAAGAQLRLDAATPLAPSSEFQGQRLDLTVFGQAISVDLPLAGRFQAMNALCALGLVIGAGNVDVPSAVLTLAFLEGVPGRLQHVASHPAHGAPVFVDYAHTPDALETVLAALRPHVDAHLGGRLVCVFGCGGDRDPGKRPVMGELAGRLADRAIVTDDNPRTEDAATIRAAVKAGHPDLEEIGDRATAIKTAIADLKAGDVLVIAGKGHEQGQIVGTVVLPFDDAVVAQHAVRELGA